MAFDIPMEVEESFMEELRGMSDEELEALLEDQTPKLSDGHLVEYAEACVKETTDFEEKRQALDRQLIAAYDNEMPEHRQKEDWQTKITLPSIFTTVFQAAALVRKAVSDKPDYFDWVAYDEDDPGAVMKAKFWKDALKYWGRRSNFHTIYPDMTEMAFISGLSSPIKCVMHPDPKGPDKLEILKIDNENLYRDPDAKPRDPQSGLYCIHQDWVDYHELVEGAELGYYINIDPSIWSSEEEHGANRRRNQQESRHRNLAERNKFRKSVRVTEVWGGILDHNGELVLDGMRYTIANKTVIRKPEKVIFPTLKWPIHQFSTIPHRKRFHGISLVEGVLKLWKLRNNLICMATDKLSFALNTMFEVDPSILQNPTDTELYPGALKFRKHGKQGSAYNEIKIAARLEEMAPLWEMTGSEMQNGSFITDLIRGTFGGGAQDVTATEQKIKYEQGMGVFESIDRNCEEGGIGALRMIQEYLLVAWSPEDHPTFVPFMRKHPEVAQLIQQVSPEERVEALQVEADISIRGVSLLLQKGDIANQIQQMMEVSDSPRFLPYVKDDKLIEKFADAINMEETVKTEEELQIEEEAKQAAMAKGGIPGGPPQGQPPPMPGGAQQL